VHRIPFRTNQAHVRVASERSEREVR
jgi:hypothetical protein